MKHHIFLAIIFLLLTGGMLSAQTLVSIGNGATVNTTTGVPTPYGTYYKNFHQQFLILASELNDAGGGAGNITSIAFNVSVLNTCSPMPNYTIKLKQTTQTTFTTTFEVGDYTTVWSAPEFMPVVGWNIHTFTTPYNWDGSSNLIVDIITTLIPGNYTQNASCFYSTTTFNSSLRYQSDSTDASTSLTGTVSTNRSNIQFVMAPLIVTNPPNPAMLISPANGATLVNPDVNLNWNSGGGAPSGFKLSLGTNNPPTNILNNQDLGLVTTYNPPQDFDLNTTYYWKVTPYNAIGDAVNCPVWSFTTHPAPIVTQLPYLQNFDISVIPPVLPYDWTSIVQASVTTAYVDTYVSTTYAHSQPNCVRLYNSTDANATVMLVAPVIGDALDPHSVRIKFWARSSSAGYPLSVGVLTNQTDPTTYQEVQNIALTATLAEYVVDLTTYTGTGRYIAFKHGLGGTSRTLYLDDISLELIAPNDLAALSITGNVTPSVGNASNYTVTVKNWGTATQTNYTVKLMSGNTELASVPGQSITPGSTMSVVVTWTPTAEGPMSIYGKVVLTGDVNSVNDNSPVLNISVMPPGATVVTIGEGNLAEGVPWEFFYKNSLFQTLYYQDELGVMGNITAITFYNNFVTNLTDKPVKLWLGTTDLADLSAGWILNGLTLVYDGTLNFPSGENTIVVPLQTPYLYTGGNLVLYANRPMDTQYFSSSDNFRAQTIGTTRARKLMSDTVTYDPLNPSATGTLSGTFPMTSFTFVVTGMGSLSGTVTSGGSPVADVLIQVSNANYNYTRITSATGQYTFAYLPIGTYTVTASKLGYETQTVNVTIMENQNTVQNISLVSSSTVSVSGHIVGSDQPTIGIANANIFLDGPLNYEGTSNANGDFTITGVLSGNTYNYTIQAIGYADLTGTVVVGSTNVNMGTLVMSELALPPVNILATENTAQTQITLTWSPPGSTGTGAGSEDFEIDNGGWVSSGFGDWQWGQYNVTAYTDIDTYVDTPPASAHSGTGMWGTVLEGGYSNCGAWSYLRKTFDFSTVSNPVLSFWHYMNGYNTYDYGLIKVNGNTVWGNSSSAVFMPWQELTIDLSAYANMNSVEISFEWFATSTVSYAGWYIDDLYVGHSMNKTVNYAYKPIPEKEHLLSEEEEALLHSKQYVQDNRYFTSKSSKEINSNRSLNGYKVWRLISGNETNENSWTLLTTNTITDTTFIDTSWGSLPDGNYRWAVKGVYTNNLLGPVGFSNRILIMRNDLAANTISGSTTPSVGTAFSYTIGIENVGTQAKPAGSYSVKLMSGDTELASVPGPTIAAGEELAVTVSWTPTTEGPMSLTGKVVLTADTNSDNNTTSPFNVLVMPSGVLAVTIGDGSQLDGIPWDFYYKNSLFQTLYYPDEIGLFGNITALSFYNNFTTNLTDKPIKIWMGTTNLQDLSAGWILDGLTLVYDGNLNFPNGQNTITVQLQTPYLYTGGNLLLYANRPMDTQYFSSSDDFLAQTIGNNRARKLVSDTVTYDPMNPSAVGTLSGKFPKTTLFFSSPGADPIFSVGPSSHNWGTVLINSVNNQNFTVGNAGGGTLTINNITISGSEMFSLQNLPTLPANLAFCEAINFTARYNPTAVGNHTATITITDNLATTYTITLNSGRTDRRERIPHTVSLSGNCIDTTLNTLPYTQNFDQVTVPILPVDWMKIVQSTSTSAVVETYASTTYAHSQPNCVRLYNPSDANATLMLIAPPLGNAIPTNTTRVKFWARSSTAGYPISIGVMVNPTDPTTYLETESISLTTTLTEYVVAFNAYTGAGKHIVFKHGLGGTGRSLYMDDVMIEIIPTNDLAATAISGNVTPSVGQESQYNISVHNWGTASQNTYTVKLFSAAGIELASATGITCAPGATVEVPVTWTPTTDGAMTIYGKVVLAGDQNNLNDQTPNLNILVNPSGVFMITIGAGDQTARMPVDMFYKNSIYEGLYYPAEMGNFMGQITGIQFYNNFITNLPNMPTKVWIGTTTLTSLSDAWIPISGLTLVFDGTINYPSGSNIITIPFTAPYLYLNGENLVIFVQRPMDTQYYSSTDYFQAQTDATNTGRSRRIQSDSTTYDPNNLPTTGTISGQFPKTTLIVIPGGVGHLDGTVITSADTPLEGVAVNITNSTYSTVTDATGHYHIANILPDDYTVEFSKYGYISQSVNITIEEDETEILNVTMQPMPTVSVTGTILASDTGAGIAGASIHLVGYQNYNTTSTAAGTFSFPAVYANQEYEYTIIAAGYTTATGTINVGSTNYNMGSITLGEVAYAPFGVVAAFNNTFTAIELSWQAPDPTAVDVIEGFEGSVFPPAQWTQIINNTGTEVIPGILPTWCRFGTVNPSGTPVVPPQGNYQAGLWWSYNHQDEWLITNAFNCPPSAHLSIDAYIYRGSTYGDHYNIKVSTDNGTNWSLLYDASTATGGWNYYTSPIHIDMEQYGGQQIKIAFQADDPPTNGGLWYCWFIDNLYIGNAVETIRFAGSELISAPSRASLQTAPPEIIAAPNPVRTTINRFPEVSSVIKDKTTTRVRSERSLQGYRVWRLISGNETNPQSWTPLSNQLLTSLETVDSSWTALPNGIYRWAVKAVYTANVTSVASFSNTMTKETQMGNIVGYVRKQNNQPIAGATVSASGVSATTNSAGAYFLPLAIGTYDVTASAAGYLPRTISGVIVLPNQNTTENFVLSPVANEDEYLPATVTELQGNFPNPFNPETTITYSIKDRCQVRLEVYNLKGQLVRTLVKAEKPNGNYKVVFNAKDDKGSPLASGIYFYRLQAGKYVSTHKMLLME
ncbi:MAG: carboxypeptidase regulatory-like domain-containing protein [Candidatus Cloacimonas sp.]